MSCAIDWTAFGLEDPGDIGCVHEPIVIVTQACVHEHVARAEICHACLAELLSYGDPDPWACGPCVATGHNCHAPLVVTEAAS